MRAAFPDLKFSHAKLEERGGDHQVLLLDQTYAVRFPRGASHDLGLEIAVLTALQGRFELAVPNYVFVEATGRFAACDYIAGYELTPSRFAHLSTAGQGQVLGQAGRFLAALHGLDPRDVRPREVWPRFATAAEHVAVARSTYLPRVADAFPKLADRIDAFFERYALDVANREVVLHGDLVDDHILLAPDGDGLAGIIDFSDVALGDPAQDLLGFWAYGLDAVRQVIAAYRPDVDDDLQGRSRRAFIRYRIERFADLLGLNCSRAARNAAEELATLLSAADPRTTGGEGQEPRNCNHTQRR